MKRDYANQTFLSQLVEEWHSVSCVITSDKENVTIAADLSLNPYKQVLETVKYSKFDYPAAHGHLSPLKMITASQIKHVS